MWNERQRAAPQSVADPAAARLLTVLLLAVACAEQPLAECVPGRAIACHCPGDLRRGARVCNSSAQFERCQCTEALPAATERKVSDRVGAAAVIGRCAPNPPERCDGQDNDCDGQVDEGEICPFTGPANNTEPFEQSVFVHGIRTGSSTYAVVPIWPARRDEATRDVEKHPRWNAWSNGYLYDTDAGPEPHTHVGTPSCKAEGSVWHDAEGRAYYYCAQSIRRDDGRVIATHVRRLAAVTPDGRAVGVVLQRGVETFAAYGPDGELTRFDTRRYAGKMRPLSMASTVSDTSAYLLFLRTLEEKRELVVVRLTSDNEWNLVRRVSEEVPGISSRVLSDGTVLGLTAFGEHKAIALLPDGGTRTVWTLNGSTLRYASGLMVGRLVQ